MHCDLKILSFPMKQTTFTLFLLLSSILLPAQTPSPGDYLPYQLGEKFTRHHTVIDYFKLLATASDQIELFEYGKSIEGRPLIYVAISSTENINKLESIRTKNLAIEQNSQEELNSLPAILWLSFNIHGNEASSTEAAMQLAYELTAGNYFDQPVLQNTVVIIDPCLNPDGRERYVNWYYQFANSIPNPNPESIEHVETFIKGRYNHYWFDLNRDWLWQTQDETIHRITAYHQWMPHVHIDFHEQDHDNNYFFGPSAEPIHKAVTDWQREMQKRLFESHRGHFIKEGWLYYTEENYDLLYPSYGDSYPSYGDSSTFKGAVGLTYEMAGNTAAGLAVLTKKGDTLTLKERIHKHFVAGVSTIKAVSENRSDLLSNYQKFFKDKPRTNRYYVFNEANSDKLKAIRTFLERNHIAFKNLEPGQKIEGKFYNSGRTSTFTTSENALAIPVSQSAYKLVQVLFEPKTIVADSLTYDITSWNIPYVYNTTCFVSELNGIKELKESERTSIGSSKVTPYAYIFDWEHISDAKFLAHLFRTGYKVSVASKAFTVKGKNYGHGAIIVAREDNPNEALFSKVSDLALLFDKRPSMIVDGNEINQIAAGSNFFKYIDAPTVALIIGDSISALNSGEIRYFLEKDLEYHDFHLIDKRYFNQLALDQYDVIMLPDGSYSTSLTALLSEWVEKGGRLISFDNASDHLIKSDWIELNKIALPSLKKDFSYDQYRRVAISRSVVGAIYQTRLDPPPIRLPMAMAI
jgi:hypothetical protein